MNTGSMLDESQGSRGTSQGQIRSSGNTPWRWWDWTRAWEMRQSLSITHFEYNTDFKFRTAVDFDSFYSGWSNSPESQENAWPDSPVSVTPQPEMWHSVPEGKGPSGKHIVFTYLDSRAQWPFTGFSLSKARYREKGEMGDDILFVKEASASAWSEGGCSKAPPPMPEKLLPPSFHSFKFHLGRSNISGWE